MAGANRRIAFKRDIPAVWHYQCIKGIPNAWIIALPKPADQSHRVDNLGRIEGKPRHGPATIAKTVRGTGRAGALHVLHRQ
jgi:hypothetical protein